MRNNTVPSLLAALLLSLGLASAAHADCESFMLPAGNKVCIQQHVVDSDNDNGGNDSDNDNDPMNICTSGTTTSLAKFQVFWGTTPAVPTVAGGPNEIAGSDVPVSSFAANFDSFSDPTLFPGYFDICAKNVTSGTINVTLCLHPNITPPCPPAGQ